MIFPIQKFSCETLKSEKVENLNFPYSSTANDFLFVPNLPSENVIFRQIEIEI